MGSIDRQNRNPRKHHGQSIQATSATINKMINFGKLFLLVAAMMTIILIICNMADACIGPGGVVMDESACCQLPCDPTDDGSDTCICS